VAQVVEHLPPGFNPQHCIKWKKAFSLNHTAINSRGWQGYWCVIIQTPLDTESLYHHSTLCSSRVSGILWGWGPHYLLR
jgi:hypothetical protein